MITTPSTIDIESGSLGGGVYNFTGSIARKICSVENHAGDHHVIQKFKSPAWYDLSRITGGVLHIRLTSSDCAQQELKTPLDEIIFHFEVKTMDDKEERKELFVEFVARVVSFVRSQTNSTYRNTQHI